MNEQRSMWQCFILFFFLFALIGCSDSEKIEQNIQEREDPNILIVEKSRLANFDSICANRYPKFNFETCDCFKVLDTTDPGDYIFIRDEMDMKNGPYVYYYPDGTPRTIGEFRNDDYYSWEYWYDSTGNHFYDRVSESKYEGGDENHIIFFKDIDSLGNIAGHWFVDIEKGEDTLFVEAGESQLKLNYEWGCIFSDSLEIEYSLFSEVDTTEIKSLGIFRESEGVFKISDFDYKVNKIKFLVQAHESDGTGVIGHITKPIVFKSK